MEPGEVCKTQRVVHGRPHSEEHLGYITMILGHLYKRQYSEGI